MLDGSSHLRISRRNALQLVTALAAAALVPLGSVASAQSGGDARPGSEPRPGSQPTTPADPAPGNRFSSPAVPGPSPQPVPSNGSAPAPAPASGPTTAAVDPKEQRWLQNHHATELWSGPDDKAISFGWVPAFSYFKMLGAQEGNRIRVQNPLTNGVAFVTAKDVGPSGAPPEWYLTQKSRLAIPARVVGGANIRRTPST